MQLYQNATTDQKTQQLLTETNAVLRRLGISAAVLAQPDLQAQLTSALVSMATVSPHGLDIAVMVAGGAQ